MSSRQFPPQDFGVIRVQSNRVRKHRERWHPLWVFFILTCVPVCLIGGLAWWLVNRDGSITQPAEPGGEAIAVATTRRVDAKNDMLPASPDSETALTPEFPDSELWSYRDTQEGLFESELPVHAHNSVDDKVFLDLLELGIKPAKLCSDQAFLRRVYIDVLGTLPTVSQVQEFLDDPDQGKRKKLIDHVLEQPEFADYWAMKWCDVLRVKAEFPINLWPNAAQAYHRWVHTAVKNNLPYDQFAHQLLTSSGSNFRTPQVNFYRALQSKEPKAIAQVVALTFLCERTDNWSDERLEGMSQFFSKVGYKPTGEWKEEIVFFDPRRGEDILPSQTEIASQAVIAVYPNGAQVEIPSAQDPREVFATWLIDDKNPWFARAIANRVWYWLLGRGIVEPPDDVRRDNRPSNLALLNHLADELIAADYNLKHLYRLILNSNAYQLACVPQSDDSRAGEHFAYYQTRRLDAEVLIDAICQITGTTETYMSIIPEPFTFLPEHQRAIALPDGSITSSFLEMFGRPARDTGMVSERNNRLTASQALHLLNSNHIRNKIKLRSGVGELLSQAINSTEIAELVYMAVLSRRPTQGELYTAVDMCEYASGRQDLIWALINSDEFLFRH
jgi:hypothetical protein